MRFFSKKGPDPVPAGINPNPVDSNSLRIGGLSSTQPLQRPGTTPYLGLSARLSQVWFNRWTVLLLLVLVRVLLMLGSLNDDLGDAKVKALAACSKVEDIGSAMASMPHYLSVGVNRLAASGITDAVHGLMKVMDMILTAVAQLILFVINMMTSTYTCLIAAAVHGGLNVSAFVVTKTTDAINDAIGGIANDISSVADGVDKAIGDAWNWIDGITGLFTGSPPSKPNIDLSSDLDKLKNIKIDPSLFVADLNNLNKELPTFQEVQNMTAEVVNFPFNLAKKAINDTYGNWTFSDSVFPVAQKKALSFCSDNSIIVDFFESLFELAHKAKIAFIVVLVLLAILVCIPMAWWEVRTWRHTEAYHRTFVHNKHDELDMYLMSSRPFTSKVAVKISNKLSKDARRRALIRWGIAYGTSLPALFVLSLAIAGLFSCLCQYIILQGVEKEVPALADQVGDFAGEVVTTLNHVSEDWANDANGVIAHYSDEINNDVLGYVVNATDAVNDTINMFTDKMDEALTFAFNGTILMDPIKEVIYCLIGLKVEAVQKGLTWVHDHAHINFPLFANDTFSAGAAKSIDGDSNMTSFLSSPDSVTTDEVTDAIEHVVNAIRNNIIQEALISTGLLLVYVLIVLVGIIRTLVGSVSPPSAEDRQNQQNQGHAMKSLSPRPSSSVRSFSEAPINRKKHFEGSDFNSRDDTAVDNPFGDGAFRTGHTAPSYYTSRPQRWNG